MSDVMNFVYLSTGVLLLAMVYAFYLFTLKPKISDLGVYKNPRIGRRKVPTIICPDGYGILKEIIDEEGDPEFGSEYCSLVIDMEGSEIILPHVNFNRDCRPYNLKQFSAGGDSPVLICCVDRNGLRNPSMLDSMRSPGMKDLQYENLTDENKRLRTDYARLRRDSKKLLTDEGAFDKVDDFLDRTSRWKKQLFAFGEGEQQFGDKEGEMK